MRDNPETLHMFMEISPGMLKSQEPLGAWLGAKVTVLAPMIHVDFYFKFQVKNLEKYFLSIQKNGSTVVNVATMNHDYFEFFFILFSSQFKFFSYEKICSNTFLKRLPNRLLLYFGSTGLVIMIYFLQWKKEIKTMKKQRTS